MGRGGSLTKLKGTIPVTDVPIAPVPLVGDIVTLRVGSNRQEIQWNVSLIDWSSKVVAGFQAQNRHHR